MDIGLFIVDGCVQLVVENGDLKADNSLETAVIISLLTDQRSTLDELPAGMESRRGWWGDMFPTVEGDEIGSKLWLADRSKAQLETLAAIENYANLCLQWMLDDSVAASVSASAEFDSYKRAIISIEIIRPTGEASRFDLIWDEQELKRA